MFPPTEFAEYAKICKILLCPEGAGKAWNSQMNQLLKSAQTNQILTKIYNVNCTISYLKQLLALAIISSTEELKSEDLSRVFHEQTESGEPPILAGLTLIEICILIAIKHLQIIYDGQPFNFEMAFHEFDKFVSTKAKMLKQERAVVMKAWETLIDLELITPVDKGTKIQKEFKLHNLQVFPDTILKTLNNVPQNVKEWATAGSYA